jgi:hypothetical protein
MKRVIAMALMLAATGVAQAAVPTVGTPSAQAKAQSSFATTFYVMHWNRPTSLDYGYDAARGELRLQVAHRGSSKAEEARLELRVRADKPGRYPLPAQGSGSFYVLGCENSLVAGKSHVEITRIDAQKIEGRFHLQGHCEKMASNSEALKDGRFSLVFDRPAQR